MAVIAFGFAEVGSVSHLPHSRARSARAQESSHLASVAFTPLGGHIELSMQQPRYMTDCEQRLARLWYNEDNTSVEEIARRLRRNKSSIWGLFSGGEATVRGVGRKAALDEDDKDRLVALTDSMVKTACVRYTVTSSMIQAKFRPRVCVRVIQEALHERGVWFYKLREKPILTDADVADRYKWSKANHMKTPAWFRQHIMVHIDNHAFKVPTNGNVRRMLAAKRVHGTFRTAGDSLKKEHVKASPKMRMNTGARSVLVAGGVGAGKVLLWHIVDNMWCGEEAAGMYSGPLAKALRSEYGAKRKFSVLEDNDPAGYQSTLAKAAKTEQRIVPFEIPKRSPDLNVMDYYFWSQMEKKLRQQERTWPNGRKETRQTFIQRLRRIVRNWPDDEIERAIGDLARRAELLYRAKGQLFDESAEL